MDNTRTHAHAHAPMQSRRSANDRLSRLADGRSVAVVTFDFTKPAAKSGRYDAMRNLAVGEVIVVANGDNRVRAAAGNVSRQMGYDLRSFVCAHGIAVERLS